MNYSVSVPTDFTRVSAIWISYSSSPTMGYPCLNVSRYYCLEFYFCTVGRIRTSTDPLFMGGSTIKLQQHCCGYWTRTNDRLLMRQTSYHCYNPRYIVLKNFRRSKVFQYHLSMTFYKILLTFDMPILWVTLLLFSMPLELKYFSGTCSMLN